MDPIIQQALLAIGSGAAVALAGQGVVQIYRGSGVLNFAHGAMALGSAQLFVWAWADRNVPLALAIGLAVGAGASMGLLTHLLVMRPLRGASQLVRIIATIGVMQILMQGSQLTFGAASRFVDSFLPGGPWRVGDYVIPKSSLVVLAVALGLTALLWMAMTFSRFGAATRAVADNELVARSLGHSPDVLAALNWSLGGALAGLAGVMLVPAGLSIAAVLLITVPAFAAAVLGGFRSYLVTTAGAIAIAMAQSIFTFQAVREGWPASIAPATPFLVVVLVLMVRGTALPTRDEAVARLPRVATTPPRPMAAAAAVVAVLLALSAGGGLSNALITTVTAAIIGLSLVVVTGLSGQISLAQYALAGVGAVAAARTSEQLGWPFIVCLAVGVLAAALGGAIFAVPALRARGPALAVVTIGLGLAVQQGILSDIDITGGFNGATPVERPTLFGLRVDAVDHPNRYAALVVGCFVLLAFVVANLRRTRIGRRLLAVRNNERAATALGISVPVAKLYAFTLAAAIAGIGGVLMAFRFDAVQYGQFSFFRSLEILSFVLIGGIGFVLGPFVGAAGVPNGLLAYLADDVGDLERWLLLGAGALLIVTLIKVPDGVMAAVANKLHARRANPQPKPGQPLEAARPQVLSLVDLTVRYGSVVALDGVSLDVHPGEVVGLIGANGAGKTTLVDAVSGFTPLATGSITLGGEDLSRASPTLRAQSGLGRCFQTIELFDDLTVRDNILAATDLVQPHHWLSALVTPARDDLAEETAGIVDELGVSDLLGEFPNSLSHGQRRIVGVARALAGRPGVLLLDEPAAGLDTAETQRLGQTIRSLADGGLGILLIEHDVDLVVAISDRVTAIDYGRTIYDGPATGVLDDAGIRSAYLGVTPDLSTHGERVGGTA